MHFQLLVSKGNIQSMGLPLFSGTLVHFKQKNILRPPMISLLCSLISLHTHTMQGKTSSCVIVARQRIGEGNVFSRVCPSVSHSVHGRGVPAYRAQILPLVQL